MSAARWAVLLAVVAPAGAAGQEYAFRHYGAEAGLPVAYAVAFDGTGSLLVGTNDGVVRFDGRAFEAVPLPVEGVVWRLTSAPDGAVFGLTTDGALFRLAPDGTAARIPTPAPLRTRLIEQIWPVKLRTDGKSRLWLSGGEAEPGRDAALYRWEPERRVWTRRRIPGTERVADFFVRGGRRATEALRLRLAADLHDEMGGGLTQVSLYSELIARAAHAGGANGEGARVAAWAQRVGEQARALSGSMRDVVWAIRPDEDTWDALELRLKDAAVALLGPAGIEADVQGEVESAPPALSPEVRQHVLLFFREALNNAVRHAGAHRVEVRWHVSRRALRLRVCDDGHGFDPAPEEEWVFSYYDVVATDAVAYVGTRDFVGTHDQIRVFDLTGDHTPRLVTTIDIAGHFVKLVLDGDRLYAYGGLDEVTVFSLADPLVPVQIGAITTVNGFAMAAEGDVLYLGGTTGVAAYGVRDPATLLLLLGAFDGTAAPVTAIDVQGDGVYLAAGDAGLYRLRSSFGVAGEPGAEPAAFAVAVAPNPARDRASLRLALPEAADVRAEVFDVTGRRVAVPGGGPRGAGAHELALDLGGLSPGVYLVRVTAGRHVVTRRLTVAGF